MTPADPLRPVRAAAPGDPPSGAAPADRGIPDVADPFRLFADWMDEAGASEPNDPNAMALATVDRQGMPSVRMVLLKGVDDGGFVFYTNTESAKGAELADRPKAALCFHWKSLRRQVRIRGPVEPVGDAEADAYFASRPRGAQIGAWASDQSRALDSRAALEARIRDVEQRHEGGPVPRPPHWSGYRVKPLSIEFWMDRRYRLHDRRLYERESVGDAWRRTRLYP